MSKHREESWALPSKAPEEWLEADSVILATGGLSFPRTGSDGTGYALVTALGHTLEPPVPALTPLTASDSLCRDAQGLTLEAALTLRVGGKKVATTRGSLLIAHFGYSGPAALDLSRSWHRAEGGGEWRVEASFAPGETRERFLEFWLAAGKVESRRTVRLPRGATAGAPGRGALPRGARGAGRAIEPGGSRATDGADRACRGAGASCHRDARV